MADFLDPTVLAGPALAGTFGFLYGRLAALLDRRAANTAPAMKESAPLRGELDTSRVDAVVLEEKRNFLESLYELLSVYEDHPALLSTDDERLLRNLSKLRTALEEVYGQYITLRGEDRPTGRILIKQDISQVGGELTGLDTDTANAVAEIIQKADRSEPHSTIIGAKIRRSS